MSGLNLSSIRALVPTAELKIASGVLTPTAMYTQVGAQDDTAPNDDLVTINTTGFLQLASGSDNYTPFVILRATSGDTITVKHGTGNIDLNGGSDFSLTGDAQLMLLYNDDTDNWTDLGAGGDGGGSVGLSDFDTDVSDAFGFLIGAALDTPETTISSNGTTITLSLQKSGGGDIRYMFSSGVHTHDCTPADTVTLTPGTDASPTENFVYILESTLALTASTAGWPTGAGSEHAKVATVVCQSAASLQTDEAYKHHRWTDHVSGSPDESGHLAHINERLRYIPAQYISGAALTPTITTNGGALDNIDIAVSSGVVYQLHRHAFPAFDTSTGSDVYVVNYNGANYTIVNDLNAANQDASGNTIANGNFTNLVIWAVVSENTSECKLFCNLPTDFYTNEEDAKADTLRYAVYTIPSIYRGTAFLIARLTLEYRTISSGTWTLSQNDDLTGVVPGTGGGGGGAQSTEFSDSTLVIYDNADSTKQAQFQASGITTGTTRTYTLPDANTTVAGTDATQTLSNKTFTDFILPAATELTISSGAITITQMHHRVDTESDAASDNLDTISGGTTGDILYLYPESGSRTVVIRHNQDNIRTWNGQSITLDEVYKVAAFKYDGTNWNEIGNVNGAETAYPTWGALPTATAISSGVATFISGSRILQISAESATTDDLIEVAGLALGDAIALVAASGHTITVKHNDAGATDKIFLASEADFDLSETNPLILIKRSSGVVAEATHTSTGGGGGGTPDFGAATGKTISGDDLAVGSDRNIIVNGEGSTDDELHEITGMTEGQEIVLRAASGIEITVIHDEGSASVPILLHGGRNVVLDETFPLKLLYVDSVGLVDVSGGAENYAFTRVDDGADYTTSSTSFVDVDATDVAVTLVTTGGDVQVDFTAPCTVSNGTASLYLDVDIDGSRIAGDDGAFIQAPPNSALTFTARLSVIATGLSAGSHTIKIQWKVSAATGTMYAGAGTSGADGHPYLIARELK